jgi:hypothetical protein
MNQRQRCVRVWSQHDIKPGSPEFLDGPFEMVANAEKNS